MVWPEPSSRLRALNSAVADGMMAEWYSKKGKVEVYGSRVKKHDAIGADPDDDTRIDPDGNVWGQNVDGSWTNHGHAGTFTGSGSPSGQKGRDRKRRW